MAIVRDHRAVKGAFSTRNLLRQPMVHIPPPPPPANDGADDGYDDGYDDGGDDGATDDIAGAAMLVGGWWSDVKHFVKKHAGDIKKAASYACSAVGVPPAISDKLAGAAVDAALGDTSAAKQLGAALVHSDPQIAQAAQVAQDAASKAVIATQMNTAVAQAASGNAAAKVMLAKVSTAAQDPAAHPDVQFAASVANTAAGKIATTRSYAADSGSGALALMASWR